MNFIVMQAQGIKSDDPRKVNYGDPTTTMYLIYEGYLNPRKFLGIAESIEEVNRIVSAYIYIDFKLPE